MRGAACRGREKGVSKGGLMRVHYSTESWSGVEEGAWFRVGGRVQTNKPRGARYIVQRLALQAIQRLIKCSRVVCVFAVSGVPPAQSKRPKLT